MGLGTSIVPRPLHTARLSTSVLRLIWTLFPLTLVPAAAASVAAAPDLHLKDRRPETRPHTPPSKRHVRRACCV
ncbi:hypothetical protein CGMCC3_g5337 [Colletotrichum fructicola]|nr:uncharacterized protein CGMCC3_g5337 [Colletotrichum fructicola]KAE9578990.1 hypothetical protein CGMCC3_g5337 [Colletotrichum fructicola]